MFKILNGYENIDSNIFFEIKKSKITRGHNFTLVKKQSRSELIVYMLLVILTLGCETRPITGSFTSVSTINSLEPLERTH